MAAVRQLSLEAYPDYTQQTDLDGVTYTFRFRWSTRGRCWHMDLHTLEGVAVVTSVRLVDGWPLLRRVVGPLAPHGELYMIDTTGQGEDASFAEFGARFGLFYFEGGA